MASKISALQKSPRSQLFDEFLLFDYLCRRLRKVFPKERGLKPCFYNTLQ